MRIGIDGMGGDHAPGVIVRGCIDAVKQMDNIICIIGDEEQIREEIKKNHYTGNQIEVIHASQVIENEDAPVKAVRTKTDSSMVVGMNHLKEKKLDVFISAGNTGAILAGGLFILGRISGIDRPALASTYPMLTTKNGVALLLDSGANAECKPNNLLEFATMGSIYMEKVFGIDKPRVGLVNIGSEDTKGSTIVKSAHELLSKSHLNFIGNVEARDLPAGAADVIICDGFVGNVILKLSEGLALEILTLLKQKMTSSVKAKAGALLLADKLKELKGEFDYSEYGGAPVLGVKGTLLKIHGSSNQNAVKNAIIKAVAFAENNVVEMIQNSVLELEEIVCSD